MQSNIQFNNWCFYFLFFYRSYVMRRTKCNV